jgi:DNA-binding helix-hairpin-helix protein with protein kinase domain
MSSITKIVNILSTKYGFDIKEATQHVNAEIQAYKNLTKEEKAAIKEAEKQAKAGAKLAIKEAKAAIKEAQKQAKEAQKQVKEAQKQAKEAQKPAQQPEKNKYFVTFHNKSKQMDAEDISFIQEDYKLEFVFQVEKITDVEIVPLCASNLSDYANFVKKHADDIDDNEYDSIWFSYQTPSQMNYTFLFHGEEYQVKFHKV